MPAGSVPVEALLAIAMSRQQGVILETIIEGHPRRVMIDKIIRRVYEDDPEGGPEAAARNIHVQVVRLNQRIAPAGWRVGSRAGHGYMLSKIEAAA